MGIENELDERGQKQAKKEEKENKSKESRLSRKQYDTAQEILAANDTVIDIEGYKSEFKELEQTITGDILGPRAFKLELVQPELISEPYLERYFKNTLESFTDFNRKGLEASYKKNLGEWASSSPYRSRLVLLEVNNDNLEDISSAIIAASPMERVVVVGLDEEKSKLLKEHLVAKWREKTDISEDEILNALTNEQTQSLTLEGLSLESLMGPHAYIKESTIDYDKLKVAIGEDFSSKLEDIILYGHSNQLAEMLPKLSEDCKIKQFLSIYSGDNFNSPDTSIYWAASLTDDVQTSIELVTSSLATDEILKKDQEGVTPPQKNTFQKVGNFFWPGFDKEVIPHKRNNFALNPKVAAIIDEGVEKNNLTSKQLEFLKSMFSDKSLYEPNLTDGLYASTITKTQSGINGEGAVVVGNALREGNIGRQVATAKGVLFAVNSTMFDTANDMNLINQTKLIDYKSMFLDILKSENQNQTVDADTNYKNALLKFIEAFATIENSKSVKARDKEGAYWRLYTLESANKTNRKNRKGINFLAPLPITVIGGYTLAVVGTILTGIGVGSPILGYVGLAGTTVGGVTLFTSLELQRKANADNLARWHRSSARAYGKLKEGLDERKKLQTSYVESMKTKKSHEQIIETLKDLNLESTQKLSIEDDLEPDLEPVHSTSQEAQNQQPALELREEEHGLQEVVIAQIHREPKHATNQDSEPSEEVVLDPHRLATESKYKSEQDKQKIEEMITQLLEPETSPLPTTKQQESKSDLKGLTEAQNKSKSKRDPSSLDKKKKSQKNKKNVPAAKLK